MTAPRSRVRRSAAESKQLLIAAAVDTIASAGLAPAMDEITLEAAVRETGVARSTAYNIFRDDAQGWSPQQAFQRAVMRALIYGAAGPRDMDDLLAGATKGLEDGADEPKAVRLRRLVRAAGDAHFESLARRRNLRAVIALTAMANSVPLDDADRELIGWLIKGDSTWRRELTERAFKPLAAAIGLVPRPGLDPDTIWDQFAVSVIAVGDGLFTRHLGLDPVLFEVRDTAISGDASTTTLYAFAIEALVEKFFVDADEATDPIRGDHR